MVSIFIWYFLSFDGRISRKEFSLGIFGLLAGCGLLSQLLLYLAFYNQAGRLWDKRELSIALSTPFLIAVAILLWPFLALAVKRLHDLNLSGWWVTALVAIPFISEFLHISPSMLLLIAVVILSSRPGQPGSNRFGNGPPAPAKI